MNFTLIQTVRPAEINSGDYSKSDCTELYIEITINIF